MVRDKVEAKKDNERVRRGRELEYAKQREKGRGTEKTEANEV